MKSCDNIFGKGWVYACVWILLFQPNWQEKNGGWLDEKGSYQWIAMDIHHGCMYTIWPPMLSTCMVCPTAFLNGLTCLYLYIFCHKIYTYKSTIIYLYTYILYICSYSDQKYTLSNTIHNLKSIVYTHLSISVNMKYTVHVTAFSKWSHWMSPERHCCWMGWLLLQWELNSALEFTVQSNV